MALTILLAHSGGKLTTDGHGYNSVEELRRWIEQQTRLPVNCQILMTTRGKNVKTSSLGVEKEIFLYDRRLLDANAVSGSDPLPRTTPIKSFPADLDSDNDLESWRNLFHRRLLWAEQVATHVDNLATQIQDVEDATNTVRRAVATAFIPLGTHTEGLKASLQQLEEWAKEIKDTKERALAEWEPAVKRLMRIPVHEGLREFGLESGSVVGRGRREAKTLCDCVDVKKVQMAAAATKILVDRFARETRSMEGQINEVTARTEELRRRIERTNAQGVAAASETSRELTSFREDVQLLVDGVRSDMEWVQNLQGQRAIATASKRAYAATSEKLPGLKEVAADMMKLLLRVSERKNATSAQCSEHLQALAQIQSLASPVNAQINSLDAAHREEEPHFELLLMTTRLPQLYGSLLIECVRRREWSEKFSGDSQRLAEELALIKEDEEKRRRKWHRNTGVQLPFNFENSSQPIRTEVNTRGDLSGGLPTITRQDVEQYISVLRPIEGVADVVRELTQAVQDLDKPSKRINKRLRGFKMGSVHEANLMASSFLGANSEEIKVLRAEKANLAEKVKGNESRIRKLEDLLHRARSSAGPLGNSPTSGGMGPLAQSPEHHHMNHLAHRRSSSEATEPLQARINALETQLAVEKEAAEQLRKEAAARVESEKEMNARILQADDTKKDLMANLESLNNQHVAERKDLQKTIEELELKLNSLYEEMDRLEDERSQLKGAESELVTLNTTTTRLREQHEQATARIEDLMRQLEESEDKHREELECQKNRVEEEAQRAQKAEDALAASEQSNTRLTEQVSLLENELKAAKETLLAAQLQHSDSHRSIADTVKQMYGHLSVEVPSLDDALKLVQHAAESVQSHVVGSKGVAGQLEEEVTKSQALEAELKDLKTRFESRTAKAKDLTNRLYTHNMRSIQLLESLGFKVVRSENSMQIVRLPRSSSTSASTILNQSVLNQNVADSTLALTPSTTQPAKPSPLGSAQTTSTDDLNLLYWMDATDSETESEKFSKYLQTIAALDLDAFSETIAGRYKKLEGDYRTMTKQARAYREKYYRARDEAAEKIAFRSFKSGDLALFLPTRNQVTRPWAAFNVGAPHYFLREHDSHKLATRDWLLARISKVEERIVDLSRSTASSTPDGNGHASSLSGNVSNDGDTSLNGDLTDPNENPFELSDGLRWYLLDAVEEKSGAPTTPGLSASTVAAANVDAKASLKSRKPNQGARKKLTDITVEQARRTTSGGGSNRNSLALTDAAAAVVRAGVTAGIVPVPMSSGGGDGGQAVESVSSSPSKPRTPIEKVVDAVTMRSRAGSLRSLAGATGGQQPPAPASGDSESTAVATPVNGYFDGTMAGSFRAEDF